MFADVGSTVGDNAFGSFELVSGVWTYTLNNAAVQDLDAGDSVVDTITYTASDGSTQQITVTINGADDAAVIGGVHTDSITEDGTTASGTLTISDVDGDDNPVFADVGSTVGDNAFGSFELVSGVWTYTLNNAAVQDLDAGDSVVDTITYTASDGSTQQITVTINGADDAAVIGGVHTDSITEDGTTASGTLTISDVDGDDNPVFADVGSTVGDNAFGSFELVSGVWTYTLNNAAVQDLDAGDSVVDTITYTASDGSTQQITVTINGADDAAVIGGVHTDSITEDGTTASGTLTISDVDGDDNPVFADVGSTVGDNAFGSFELVSGVWTYTLNNAAVQDLDAGDSVVDTITYTASDGSTQQITVTINGADDAAVIGGVHTDSITEDGTTASGTLTISDVDGDDNPVFADVGSTVGDNAFGSFELVSGVWTYTLNNAAVQDLDAGDSVVDTITYTASDGSTQQITVTINGADDAAVIGGVHTDSITEDGTTASGTLTISDVDGDDNPVFADVGSTVGDNAFGSFELVSGVWTYTLNNAAVQDLDAGDSVVDTITYTASDGSTQQITVTINGADDAAVIGGVHTDSITEDGTTASGTLTISDVDGDDNPVFADVGSTVGDNAFGSFELVSGVWTYTLNNAAVQDLDAGDSVVDTITYTASDAAPNK